MKKFLVYLSMLAIVAAMSINLTSCGGGDDEPEPAPAPTVQFLADVDPDDGYKVNITVQATDVTSLSWEYGDGNTSSESGNHVYTYEASGDYTIKVTASGEGGTVTASKSVTIVASLEEIIAGVGNDGKTWVLTQQESTFAGKIGAGTVDNGMALIPGFDLIPDNVMGMFGLGDEYSDEFTFYQDGTFKVDVKNNQVLAGIFYGNITGLIQVPSDDPGSLPLCAISYQNIDGSWELSYDDLVVTAYNEFKDPAVLEDVTFTFGEDSNVANLVLSQGGYVGFVDLKYPAIPEMGLNEPVDNSFYIIKEVTPEAMHVAIGINGVTDVDGVPVFMHPTFMLHLTLVPK